MKQGSLPPPPKLRTPLLLLLLLAGLAAPVAAQTTVTSSGRDGPTACLSRSEVNAASLSITALSTTSVSLTTPAITWNEYVGRLGDIPAPAEANVNVAIYNAKTNALVRQSGFVFSSTVPYAGESGTMRGLTLAPKTSYYMQVAVTSSNILPQVFARRCFMTGGTYTIAASPIASGPTQGSTGCFTISPLTQQDVRNCWCGRKTTRPLFSSTQDNTDWLNMWGCR